jgi:CRISPR-associated protein Cmr1
MRVTLQMQTPLWTGGVDSNSNRVQETGIIGSLRWWYEAIVRGLGGNACDPTTHHCGFDEKAFARPNTDDPADWRAALNQAGLCDACQAYGATGWAQRFRLRLRGGKTLGYSGVLNIRPRGSQQNRGWYLLPGLIGKLGGMIVPRPYYDSAMLVIPLFFAERWGALGARTQHGYGVTNVELSKKKHAISMDQAMFDHLPTGQQTPDKGLPSLRNMFFAKATFTTGSTLWWQEVVGLREIADDSALRAWVHSGSVPVAPTLRNQIRYQDGLSLEDYGAQNFIFGSSRAVCKECYERRCHHRSGQWERVKTKLYISSAYPLDNQKQHWEIRIWGWVPHQLPRELMLDREKMLSNLKERLGDKEFWRNTLGDSIHFVGLDWREFAAPSRDKKTGNVERPLDFLTALLT